MSSPNKSLLTTSGAILFLWVAIVLAGVIIGYLKSTNDSIVAAPKIDLPAPPPPKAAPVGCVTAAEFKAQITKLKGEVQFYNFDKGQGEAALKVLDAAPPSTSRYPGAVSIVITSLIKVPRQEAVYGLFDKNGCGLIWGYVEGATWKNMLDAAKKAEQAT